MIQSAAWLFHDPINVSVAAVLIATIFLQLREIRRLHKQMNELMYRVSELKMLISTI